MFFAQTKAEIFSTMNKFLLFILLLFIFSTGVAQQRQGNLAQAATFKTDETQPVLAIYPNPCKNKKVTIELTNQELSEIRITNITGKEVLFKKINIPVNKIEIELDNFPNGIYLLQAKSTQNKMFVKKLMISSN